MEYLIPQKLMTQDEINALWDKAWHADTPEETAEIFNAAPVDPSKAMSYKKMCSKEELLNMLPHRNWAEVVAEYGEDWYK